MSAGDNSFELSSDEEDDILGTLRQQTAESRSSGGRSSTSYDPYGADTNSSSSAAFGRAPGTTSTSGDFGAMRDAFREAGLLKFGSGKIALHGSVRDNTRSITSSQRSARSTSSRRRRQQKYAAQPSGGSEKSLST